MASDFNRNYFIFNMKLFSFVLSLKSKRAKRVKSLESKRAKFVLGWFVLVRVRFDLGLI